MSVIGGKFAVFNMSEEILMSFHPSALDAMTVGKNQTKRKADYPDIIIRVSECLYLYLFENRH
jgi:hypothetical protein